MLVDSHCHLDYPEFGTELDQVVRRAHDAGVGWMLTICTRLNRFEHVLKVAQGYGNIFCSVGVHPHEAGDGPVATAGHLAGLARHPKVIGFGETGLDYYYEHSSRDRQKESFRAHIQAARESGLPVIIHTRDADADMAEILSDEYAKGPFSGVLHCFSSSAQLAETALALGLYISISGIVTFKNAESLRETVKIVPLDRLLVETDAPYLAPDPHRGKRNEPAFTVYTADKVAEIRGISKDRVEDETTANFFRLFSKAEKTPTGHLEKAD